MSSAIAGEVPESRVGAEAEMLSPQRPLASRVRANAGTGRYAFATQQSSWQHMKVVKIITGTLGTH